MRVFQLCLSESIGGVLTNGRCAHAPHPTPGLGEAKEGASLVGCVHTLPTLLLAWARLVWGGPTDVAPRPTPGWARPWSRCAPSAGNLLRGCGLGLPAAQCPSGCSLSLRWSRPGLSGACRLVSGTEPGGPPSLPGPVSSLSGGWPQGSTHGWPPAGPAHRFLNPASGRSCCVVLSLPCCPRPGFTVGLAGRWAPRSARLGCPH